MWVAPGSSKIATGVAHNQKGNNASVILSQIIIAEKELYIELL
jgi:hypothetical protein